MTVREVMEVMAQWDPDMEVVPCDWDEVCAIRACRGFEIHHELRWEPAWVHEDDDDEED